MKLAHLYSRHSVLEQAKGDSVRRQTESALKWCEENGYTPAERKFYDKAKSGYYGENFKEDSELQRFIKLHAEGKIAKDAVLIIDTAERFSRLPISKSVNYFLNVVNSGIGLVFSGSYDKRVITSELIDKEPGVLYTIIGELNRGYRESADKSYKVKSALAQKKLNMQAGLVLSHNNVPKYFKFVPKEKYGRTAWKGEYVKHPEYAVYVKELVDGFLAGKSLYELAKEFNARNIPTFRRKFEWHRNTVRQILQNRVLIGEFLGVPNYVEPIIDETTFLKVQNILSKNVSNRGKKAGFVNVFRGVAFCATCGQAMNVHGKMHRGYPYRYFRCSNYGRRGSCAKAYLHLDAIEQDFFFNFLCKDPYKLVNGEDVAEVNAIRNEVTEKTARLNVLNKKVKQILAIIESVPLEQAKQELLSVEKQRNKLESDIDALNAKAAAIQDMPDDLGKWLVKVTRFGEGENGEDVTHVLYEETIEKMRQALKDNAAREKLRVFLPSVIGKILVDSKERSFTVLNRGNRVVYKSPRYPSQNNNTERWRNAVRTWTKRKLANGRVIEVKRYQSRHKSKLPPLSKDSQTNKH